MWAEADERERFAALDIACAEWRHNGPDFHLLRRAHAWGPLPDRARDDEERRQWIAFWCAALDVMLARPSNSSSDDAGLYPDEDEAWLLENAAIVVLQMRSDELPEQLWSRVIELPDHAHDWIDVFIHDVYVHVLAGESTLESAIATLRAIVGHALSRPHGWSMYERVWDSLIGVGDYVIEQWKPEHAAIVEALVTLHDTWRTINPTFNPTEPRDGVFLTRTDRPSPRTDHNKRIIEQALGLYLSLLEYASENGWQHLHLLAAVKPVPAELDRLDQQSSMTAEM